MKRYVSVKSYLIKNNIKSVHSDLCMRGKILGKKGEEDPQHETLMNINELVLLSLLLLMLFGFLSSISTGKIMVKEYLSRDLAMVIDTLYIPPYDTPYMYDGGDESLSEYNFEFTDGKVTVSEVNAEKGSPVKLWYPFARDNNIVIHQFPSLANDVIEMRKKEHDFYIGTSEDSQQMLICPQIDTKDPDWKAKDFVIDPGHGGDDTGYSANIGESIFTRELSYEFSEYLKTFGVHSTATRKLKADEGMTFSERKGKVSPDSFLISFHMGYDTNKYFVPIKIYANKKYYETNAKFVCILYNKLFEELKGYSEISVDYVDLSLIPKDDPRQILDETKNIGLFIEIGNSQHPEGILLTKSTYGTLSRLIFESMESYYE
jgi:N-acetylmuramoyl-L-alanine amidase